MYSVISPEHEYNEPLVRPKRRYFKKIVYAVVLVVVVTLGYLGIRFLSAANDIFVEPKHTGLSAVFCLFKKCETQSITIVNDPNPIPADDPDRLNILVLGIRGEEDVDAGGLLTDTMMLLSFDKKTGKGAIVSLPRDLYIDMTGILTDGQPIALKGKINEIYVHGASHDQGLTLTSQMISRVTGLWVDKAVLFDFKAFEEIVHSVGGVDITLDKPFVEKSQWGYEFSLPAGKNHLEGEQVMYYVRSRFSSSDFDRARRQQEVLFAIKKKATELGFLANPSKIDSLMSALKGNLKTNFQIYEIKDMLKLAQSLKSSNLKTTVISTDNLLYETHLPNKEYILLPKGDDFKLVREYFKTILAE